MQTCSGLYRTGFSGHSAWIVSLSMGCEAAAVVLCSFSLSLFPPPAPPQLLFIVLVP